MTTDRISGRLVSSYAVDVPSDPGWAQPWRHQDDSAGGDVDRDQAPAGGGWQPYGWDSGVNVLPGESYSDPASHKGAGHRGAQGRGAGRSSVDLDSRDRNQGGLDSAAPLLGAGGAANGGLRPSGVSAPWANAPVARRRADGKVATNAGGVDLGHEHTHPTVQHRQALHFNRPSLRFIRLRNTNTGVQDSPYPGGKTSPVNPVVRARPIGAQAPRGRTILRPYGQTDTVADVPQPTADAGPIGGDWVQ